VAVMPAEEVLSPKAILLLALQQLATARLPQLREALLPGTRRTLRGPASIMPGAP
jgi:hypothetical protein